MTRGFIMSNFLRLCKVSVCVCVCAVGRVGELGLQAALGPDTGCMAQTCGWRRGPTWRAQRKL